MTVEEPQVREIPLKWALLILLSLFVIACLPIWMVEYPPLVDYPLHVARAYLLSLPQNGQGITDFYRAAWQPLPNLGMDILVSQLMHVVPPMVAGKLFLCLIQLGLLSGGFAFSVALLKRITIAAFLPVFALYDLWFWMGFANYLFGIGIAFWAVAFWLWSEDWPKARRWAVAAAFAIVLIVCHLMAFLVAVGVAFVLSLPKERDWVKPVVFGSLGVCVLAYLGLTVLGKTPVVWQGRAESLTQAGYFAVPGVLFFGSGLMRMSNKKYGIALVFSLLVFIVLGPSFLGGTAFACDRLTLPLILILFANARPHPSLWPVYVLPAGLACLAYAVYGNQWQTEATFGTRLLGQLRQVPDYSTLASFDLGLREQKTWQYQRHIPDWLLIEKPVFVAQNFAKKRQQPMVFQPAYEEWHRYQNNNPVELDTWQQVEAELPKLKAMQDKLDLHHFEQGRPQAGLYALVFHKKGQTGKPAGTQIVGEGGEFTLLKIR